MNAIDVRQRTELAVDVIRFGEERRMTFKHLPHRGLLVEPLTDGEFVYRDARNMPNDFEMPLEAWRRFFAVYENYLVAQVVIADELQPYKEWERTKEVGIGVGVGAATGVIAVAAGLLSLLAMAPMALLADPKLIVVLEDGTWISICEWF